MIQVFTTIFSVIATPLLSLVVWQLQRMIQAKENDSRGLKLLLKSQMKEDHDKYIKRGSITSDELADFKEMYEVYHALKGNGQGTIWMEDVEKLERVE